MRVIFMTGILFPASFLYAQSTYFPLDHLSYLYVNRQDILQSENFSTKFKPYSRKEVHAFLSGSNAYLNKEMRAYSADSIRSRRTFLKKFFQYPADFYAYNRDGIDLHLNPMIRFSFGRTNDGSGNLSVNTRGVEIHGTIDDRIAFYTNLTENQVVFPGYVNAVKDSTLTIPYEGFWKQFGDTGVDFLRARGYMDFAITRHVSAQFGYGKHFIGDGMRSLFLSDVSNAYPYLRINTKTKVFEYTNLFTEMIADVRGGAFGVLGTGGFSKKYMVLHHLNIKIKPNVSVGLFESVVYGSSTAGIKLEYLNPLIFYRSVEQQNGSSDNAFVGLDFKWNIKNRTSLYGQLMVDELVVSHALSGNGWWGNKQGVQFGAKYVNAFGIENLMLQGELNRVRPYTYAHTNGLTNYSHYNQAVAHPLGANFTEFLGRATFSTLERWNFELVGMMASYGNDHDKQNYGRDILKSYTLRRRDALGRNIAFGNEHLQGNKTDLMLGFFRTSYMLKHNVFIDGNFTYRKEKDSDGLVSSSSAIFGVSFRWNVTAGKYLF